MKQFAIKGSIVHAQTFGTLTALDDGYIVVENGRIAHILPTLPEKYAALPVRDYTGLLVMPAFADMHLHAPQFPMLGTGMDLQLLEWLNQYTFPTEAAFADAGFAREVYHTLAKTLVELGTTRVCIFSSIHRTATHILMEELEHAGITGYAGKVNMDRNAGNALQETTAQSLSETIQWLDECAARYTTIRPILTPRFTPACTDELLRGLGKIAEERGLRVQSHLSENLSEIEWVRALTGCDTYYQSYARHGLFFDHTLMAHCVHSNEHERTAMRKHGVFVVHCPDSNINLRSGIAPVRKLLNDGVQVLLGSDIAGGAKLNMMEVAAAAIRSSKQKWLETDGSDAPLTALEAFYLATSAGAVYFGEQPGFAAGNLLHALVVDDRRLSPAAHALSIAQRLERVLYLKGNIVARFSEGRLIG